MFGILNSEKKSSIYVLIIEVTFNLFEESYFVVSNDKNFYVYKYDIKNDNEPFLIQAGSTASKIMGLQFAK